MSIMHNHSIPKEHLATWNRTETTRKAVRELYIACFSFASQPHSSIWDIIVKSVSSLDLMQRMAIDYSRATISDKFNEIFRRFAKFRVALHFEGGRTQFYIGWREVTIYCTTRQLRGAANKINQSNALLQESIHIYIRPRLHT